MKRNTILLMSFVAFLSLFAMSMSHASSVRSTQGFLMLPNGIKVEVIGERIYNVRRIKGKVRHMSWSYMSFRLVLPVGMMAHRSATVEWSGKHHPLKGNRKFGSEFMSNTLYVRMLMKRGTRYTSKATFHLTLKQGKKPKTPQKMTRSITWRLLFQKGKRSRNMKYKVTLIKAVSVPKKRK